LFYLLREAVVLPVVAVVPLLRLLFYLLREAVVLPVVAVVPLLRLLFYLLREAVVLPVVAEVELPQPGELAQLWRQSGQAVVVQVQACQT